MLLSHFTSGLPTTTIGENLSDRFETQDYRFLEIFQLASDDSTVGEVLNSYQTLLNGSREALERAIDDTRRIIEQAVVDGVIAEEDRAEHISEVEKIIPDEVLHFRPRYRLLEDVREKLTQARDGRLEYLHREWQTIHQQPLFTRLAPDIQEAVHQRVSGALDVKDTRLVDEYLAHIREELDSSRNEWGWLNPEEPDDLLNEFLRQLPNLEEASKKGLKEVSARYQEGTDACSAENRS